MTKAKEQAELVVGINFGTSPALDAAGSGTDSIAIGNAATTTTGDYGIAIGYSTDAYSYNVSIGYDASAGSGTAAISIGYASNASGANSIALSNQAVASGTSAIAIGIGTDATQTEAIAIGETAQATATQAISIGSDANASGTGSIAIGDNSVSGANTNVIAIGTGATTSGASAIAIGPSAVAYTTGVSIGSSLYTNANPRTDNVAIGRGIAVSGGTPSDAGTGNVLLGRDVVSTNGTGVLTLSSSNNIFIGGRVGFNAATNGASTFGGGASIHIGYNNFTCTGSNNAINDGVGTITIGSQMSYAAAGSITLGNYSIGIGYNANYIAGTVGAQSISIGYKANYTTAAGADSIAIGETTVSTGTQSIAIGSGASATATAAVAIGDNVANTTTNTVRIGTSATNYFELTAARRIANLVDPTSAQEAATKNYVDTKRKQYYYTATAGQTTFSGSDLRAATLAYTAGYVDVFLNGVKLIYTEYTASNGTSVVLGTGATVGDSMEIVAY